MQEAQRDKLQRYFIILFTENSGLIQRSEVVKPGEEGGGEYDEKREHEEEEEEGKKVRKNKHCFVVIWMPVVLFPIT